MNDIPPEKLSVKLLAEILDPFRTLTRLSDPDGKHEITHRMIQTCLDENCLNPNYYLGSNDCDNKGSEWTLLDHAARIAWLVVNGWTDPIELDFGIPSLGHSWYPLLDGHHRLAAAIFRQNPFILANCSGSVEEIERFRWTNYEDDADAQGNQSSRDTTP